MCCGAILEIYAFRGDAYKFYNSQFDICAVSTALVEEIELCTDHVFFSLPSYYTRTAWTTYS